MDKASLTTLSALFSILCNGIANFTRNINLAKSFKKRSNMLMLCKQKVSTLLQTAGSNKSINADCQTDVVFLKARCAAGYFKRYL